MRQSLLTFVLILGLAPWAWATDRCDEVLRNPILNIVIEDEGREFRFSTKNSEFLGKELLQMNIKHASGQEETLDVSSDNLTNSIDVNTEVGAEVMKLLLKSMSEKFDKTAVVFFDINFLGLFNKKFLGGQQSGNEYIEEFGRVLKEKLSEGLGSEVRATDMVFRVGGDEWVALIPEISEEDLMSLMSRINNSVFNNRHLREEVENQKNIKLDEMISLLAKMGKKGEAPFRNFMYTAIGGARQLEYAQFSEAKMIQVVTKLEKELSQMTVFEGTLAAQFTQKVIELSEIMEVFPSVSIGSTYLRPGDTYETLLETTSQQTYEVKKAFKNREYKSYKDFQPPNVLPPVAR